MTRYPYASTTLRESNLEALFNTQIRRAGGISIKLVPLDAGIPDRLVLLPGGIHYLVELKAPDGAVSPIQRVWHQKSQTIGHPVVTLYGRDGVFDWLEDVLP